MCHPDVVREHIMHDPPGIVVVSAPGLDPERGFNQKVTDLLIDYREGHDSLSPVVDRFEFLKEIMGIDEILKASAMAAEADDWRQRGWPVEALGERWTAILYAAYLSRRFIDAADIIRFDEDELDLSASEAAVRHHLKPGELYVVPGFYGANNDGEIKTLGRGGSDVTPAVICRSRGIEEYHNYSDVDGVMEEDPADNPNAGMFDWLHFEQTDAMIENGCNLLHSGVCGVLVGTGVTIVMRNTFGRIGNRGTIITEHPKPRTI